MLRSVSRVGSSVRQCGWTARWCSSASRETTIADKIKANLATSHVDVVDTSGGCGTMYNIEVVAEEFRGTPMVKQHQMLSKILEEEIPKWHGFTFNTKAPKPT